MHLNQIAVRSRIRDGAADGSWREHLWRRHPCSPQVRWRIVLILLTLLVWPRAFQPAEAMQDEGGTAAKPTQASSSGWLFHQSQSLGLAVHYPKTWQITPEIPEIEPVFRFQLNSPDHNAEVIIMAPKQTALAEHAAEADKTLMDIYSDFRDFPAGRNLREAPTSVTAHPAVHFEKLVDRENGLEKWQSYLVKDQHILISVAIYEYSPKREAKYGPIIREILRRIEVVRAK